MHRLANLGKSLLLVVAVALPASADHNSELRRDYELRKSDFTREYHAQRDRLRHSYHRSRDALNRERKRTAHIRSHERRSDRRRTISRELAALAREHGRLNSELTRAYTAGLRTLREDYERARDWDRRARRREIVSIGPVDRYPAAATHPSGYGCQTDVVPYAPGSETVYRDRYQEPAHRRHRPAFREANGMDLAVAILSLFN